MRLPSFFALDPWNRISVSARVGRRALSSEAIAAVNRAVASGLERHRGVPAAFCANYRVHLTSATAESVAVALGALGLAAVRAAFRLVGVAFLSVVRLIVRGERERLATLNTGEGSVLVIHSLPLSVGWLTSRLGHRS